MPRSGSTSTVCARSWTSSTIRTGRASRAHGSNCPAGSMPCASPPMRPTCRHRRHLRSRRKRRKRGSGRSQPPWPLSSSWAACWPWRCCARPRPIPCGSRWFRRTVPCSWCWGTITSTGRSIPCDPMQGALSAISAWIARKTWPRCRMPSRSDTAWRRTWASPTCRFPPPMPCSRWCLSWSAAERRCASLPRPTCAPTYCARTTSSISGCSAAWACWRGRCSTVRCCASGHPMTS